VFQNWLQIPIILSLGCVVMGSSDNNLTKVFMQALMHEGGLTKELICNRFMASCGNRVSIFQGIQTSVIQQISNICASHSMGVHYMAHITNPIIESLANGE
jgi:hypothetical protein